MSTSGQITQWLRRLHDGDEAALEQLMPLLYDELRLLARKQLRNERPGHTLSTTGLVNEAYLRLVDQRQLRAEDRPQFFAIAATTMRRILVDYARTRKRLKRGGGQVPIPLEEAEQFLTEAEAEEVLAVEAALDRLTALAPRAVQVVQCRFFSGLTLDETAEALGVSVKTVQRDWLAARAWLRKEIACEV
jgi:RNA polymerase sigma-70 factor (ECF subfamily)